MMIISLFFALVFLMFSYNYTFGMVFQGPLPSFAVGSEHVKPMDNSISVHNPAPKLFAIGLTGPQCDGRN